MTVSPRRKAAAAGGWIRCLAQAATLRPALPAGVGRAPARRARLRPASPAAWLARARSSRGLRFGLRNADLHRRWLGFRCLAPPAPPRYPDQAAPVPRQRAPLPVAATVAFPVRHPEVAPRARIHRARPTTATTGAASASASFLTANDSGAIVRPGTAPTPVARAYAAPARFHDSTAGHS